MPSQNSHKQPALLPNNVGQTQYVRSKAINTILFGAPDFLSRFSIVFFIIVTGLLLSASFIIKYNEDISFPTAAILQNKNSMVTKDNWFFYSVVSKKEAAILKTGSLVKLRLPAFNGSEFEEVLGTLEHIQKLDNEKYEVIIFPEQKTMAKMEIQFPSLQCVNGTVNLKLKRISLFKLFIEKIHF